VSASTAQPELNSNSRSSGFHRGPGFDPKCATCRAFRQHLAVARVLAEGQRRRVTLAKP
jgi:hypothetical protein